MHSHHDHKQQNSTHRHESEKHAHTAQKTCCSNSADDSLNTAPLAADHQRYSWQIKGMDCPSCARKVETAVGNLSGVEQVKVLFATEKLVVDAKSDIRQQVQDAVTRAGFSLVNTVGASGQQSPAAEQKFREYFPLIILTTLMVLSWVASLFSPEMGRIAFIITTLVGLVPIVSKAWKLTRSGTPFAIETLMSVAAIGALFIGATAEAAMVLLLFMLGELLESYAAGRARRGVSALMALVPEEALLLTEGQRRRVPVASLRPGDVIEIAPGARLPADAKLVTAFASFDESALTGESIPVERQQGEKVAAGSLSVDRAAQMQVVSEPGNNAIDRILQLIERAEERRAPIERFIDRFSRIYTPLIMLLSVLVILIPPIFYAQSWDIWIYRGLTLLLIGCPCALVISTPAAITSALAAATRRGALIKGGAALEQLGLIQTVAFDKTGTLTEGKPQVTDVLPVDGMTERRLIALAAAVEAGSHHPLATAILQRATQDSPDLPLANERRALAGIGVEGVVDGLKILVSSPGKLAAQTLDSHWQTQLDQLESSGKTAIAVLENDRFIGLLALRDTLRSDAKAAINALKKLVFKA